MRNIKANLVLLAHYKKPVNEKEERMQMNFKTKNMIILPTTDILEYIKIAERKILTEMDEFYAKASGWTLSKIDVLELRINYYDPIHAATHIDLPKMIHYKRAVLNIKKQRP